MFIVSVRGAVDYSRLSQRSRFRELYINSQHKTVSRYIH